MMAILLPNGLQTCDRQGIRSTNFQLKNKYQMKDKFQFNRYTLAFSSLLLAVVLLSSCADNTTSTVKIENEAQQRIYGKGSTVYCGREYHIIEVDGVEYIASYGGGICPLVKNNR